jgi:hypothetical protein
MAGCQNRIKEIFERMVFALNSLIHQDDAKDKGAKEGDGTDKDGQPEESSSPFRIKLEPIKVPPKLKIFAEEILRENHSSDKDGDA